MKGKQKITLEEWTIIGKYNYAKKSFRPFCTYTLEMDEEDNILRCQKLSLWFYIVIFIPLHICLFFAYAWEEGLSHYEIAPRFLGYDTLSWGSESWERAKKILVEKYSVEMEGEKNHG